MSLLHALRESLLVCLLHARLDTIEWILIFSESLLDGILSVVRIERPGLERSSLFNPCVVANDLRVFKVYSLSCLLR